MKCKPKDNAGQPLLARSLNIGDFATICRTTKDTLLHYEKKGLLVPKYIAENGYRKYGIEQYLDFEVISFLKMTGCNLREIKSEMCDKNKSGYLCFIRRNIDVMRNQYIKIAGRLKYLESIVRSAEEAEAAKFDTLLFMDHKYQKISLYKTDPDNSPDITNCAEEYSKSLINSFTKNNGYGLPLGTIILKENAEKMEFVMSYFFSTVIPANNREYGEIKKGEYASWYHFGDRASHKKIFSSMIDNISKIGLSLLSDVYVYDKISYILLNIGNEYIAKYFVRIK